MKHDASPIIQGVADRISQMVRMPLKNADRFKLCIIKRMKNTIIIGTVLMNLMMSLSEEYMKNGGQRLITVLGYLRDVPKGVKLL